MSKISIAEIEKVAELARIELSPEERSKLMADVGSILDFVKILQTIDTGSIVPTSQVTGLSDVWREDKIVGCEISPGDLLRGASLSHDGLVKVKRVL